MSIIGKIRENSLLIFIVVGVAMLLFVIDPSKIINWFGGSQRQDVIGEFRGNDMHSIDWKYDLYTQGASDDQQKNQVWQEMIKDTLFKTELSKLGLEGLSKEELNALIWGEPGVAMHPNVQNIPDFKDANGQFSIDSLQKKLPQILSNPAMKPRWKQFFEEPLKNQRNKEKYLAMIKQGIYVTSVEAKESIKDEQTKADITFAFKNYASIADSLVVYSDDDLKKFYEEHKTEEEYEQKIETRAFDYVDIEIVPSEEDKERALEKISLLKDDFAKTKNDSLFVVRYAETATYDGLYKKSNSFPVELDSVLQKSDSGTLVGPYFDNGFYKMSKIVGFKPEKEATVRHILLAFNGDTSDENDAKLKSRADSLIKVIRSQKNFEAMVEKFTDDPGSKNAGGKYEWFPEGQMVPEFNDFSFEKPIGTLGSVKTTYGYHIIEVLDRRQGKTYKVATVDVKVVPQEETKNNFYDKALEIYNKAEEVGFDIALEELGYISKTENLNLNMARLSNPALANNSGIIRWVFNAEKDKVSEPFMLGDRVVVAAVKEIKEEGVMSFESARDKVEKEVLKLKKAEYLKNMMAGAKSVEEVAAKWGVDVRNIADLTFSAASIQGTAGNEMEIVGKVFGMPVNQVSELIEGNSGAFVIIVNKKDERTEPTKEDLDAQWSKMLSSTKGRANSGPINALIKQADVKDYRKRLELKDPK